MLRPTMIILIIMFTFNEQQQRFFNILLTLYLFNKTNL